MKPYKLKPSVDFLEEFIVRYWLTKPDGFKGQGELSVFFCSKNRHDAAIRACMKETGAKREDIVSVAYV